MDPHRPDCLSRLSPPSPEPDWGGLHRDILALILKCLKQIEDFVVFGSVCKSWRIVARDNKRCLAPHVPWLMLQENPGNKYHRQIYSLSKEDILTKNLYIPELNDKRCVGLTYGWVFTVSRLGGEMNLVHPISRKQIELPPHTSIEGYKDKATWPSYIFLGRVALRGNPSESSDFMVMAVHSTGDCVYSWRPGSKHWILVMGAIGIQTVTCYQDQFYAVEDDGGIFVFKNDDKGSIVPHRIGKVKSKAFTYWNDTPYIVGSTRELLIVVRERYSEEKGGEGFRGVARGTSQSQGVDVEDEDEDEDDDDNDEEEEEEGDLTEDLPEDMIDEEMEVDVQDEEGEEGEDVTEDIPEEVLDEEMEWEDWRYGLVKFHVFKFDLINGEHKKIKGLGDRAIFVGHSSSICFEHVSELPGIKSNHIYFTDDYDERYVDLFKGGGKDMGVYSLKDGQTTKFKIDESSHRSRICPPFWFIPSL